MQRRSFMGLAGASLVCGCSGAVHRLPAIGQDHLALARSEVRASGGPERREVPDAEVMAILRAASRRIVPPASRLCGEMNVGECDWKFRLSRDRSINAAAWPAGYIVVNRGIVEYAANEEEVCLVIAHEIGHQAANHVVTGMRNQAIGSLVGAAIVGAVAAAAGASGDRASVAATRRAMEMGARVGQTVGQLSFSKEQEREADYLAALILYRSGVDLAKARGFLVKMARLSDQETTGLLDTHPAGPERVAGWDRAVAEIRAANGRLPPRS